MRVKQEKKWKNKLLIFTPCNNALDNRHWALPELGLRRLHLAQALIQVTMPASGGYPTHTEHHWRCSNNNALANYL